MKKLILLLFLMSCSSSNSNYDVKNQFLDFNKNTTFDEFKELLIRYSKSNPYPNLDR